MNDLWRFLSDAANWQGTSGIWARLVTHLWVSALACLSAAVVALPVGMWFGHRRSGATLATAVANIARAVPSLAVLAFVVAAGGGIGFVPTYVAMVALALPPIFVAATIGIVEIDPAITDAGRGAGMTPWQVFWQLERPLSMPLVLSGLRIAVGQVIATATLGAFVGYNTLGRFITVGRANRDDGMLFGGVILVVSLAMVAELGFRRLGLVLGRRGRAR